MLSFGDVRHSFGLDQKMKPPEWGNWILGSSPRIQLIRGTPENDRKPYKTLCLVSFCVNFGPLPSPAEPGREAICQAIWEHLGIFLLYAPPKSAKSLIKPVVYFKMKPNGGSGPFCFAQTFLFCTYKKGYSYV